MRIAKIWDDKMAVKAAKSLQESDRFFTIMQSDAGVKRPCSRTLNVNLFFG